MMQGKRGRRGAPFACGFSASAGQARAAQARWIRVHASSSASVEVA
jgi:hypothetical protein